MYKKYTHLIFNLPNIYTQFIRIVVIAVMMIPFIGFAQFTVKGNTIITVSSESKLVSLEETNTLESSILGTGTFYLANKNQQQLHTETNVTLPNVHINAEGFTLTSSLEIRGNLTVSQGELDLYNTITIHGELHLEEDSTIPNANFILFPNKPLDILDILGTSLLVQQQHTSILLYSNTKTTTAYTLPVQPATIKPIWNTVAITSQYCTALLDPPPEVV